MKSLFRTKSIESALEGAKKSSLKKTLTAVDLVLLSIGCIIGGGIFVLTGVAAAKYAGPAISLSYFFSGVVCIFAALAYTELAVMIPVAGSAYTYSYVVLGEFIAWIVAWALILEYTLISSTVAAGWSGYLVGILKTANIAIPEYLTKGPFEGGVINLPAVAICVFVGLLLLRGTKESLIINRILVAIKLGVIFLFLAFAAPHIKMENYADFMPFGWNGVIVGSAAIFFAYLGFDAIATTAEECKNPNRDLPIGIIGGLLICAALYLIVSLVLTGIVHYSELNNAEPMAYALRANGSNIGSALVATGTVAGLMAVLLVFMYGQSRIFLVMARDGLIPPIFSKLHKKFGTPYVGCLFVAFSTSMISGFTPIQIMGDLSSLGTLFAFVMVAVAVVIFRIRRPELERPFKCPAVFVVGPLAVLSCGYLLYQLFLKTGIFSILWFSFGIVVYFLYAYRKSPLNKKK
ncbi:MAG: amino acid permease [Rickettsiales bacterium]|nr:amino acid permease [Rickettsiales bacterium]